MLTLSKFFEDDHVVAFITDQSVDFSLSESTFREKQNKVLQQFIGQSLKDLALIQQVHGKDIKIIRKENYRHLEDADGLLTNESLLPLSIRTADCLPVFIYDPLRKIVGLVHAGWRGTYKSILKNAIHLMHTQWESSPADLKILFGPSIRDCCYQVGEEFSQYFPQETKQSKKGLFFNLNLANKNQLIALGVREENIADCGICTFCDEDFFSYRRQGYKAGRMLSLIMLK